MLFKIFKYIHFLLQLFWILLINLIFFKFTIFYFTILILIILKAGIIRI